MIRRFPNVKKAVVFRTTLCVLAAAAVLAGCGPVKMGSAATVDDRRITTSQLDSTVSQWQKEFAKNPRAGMLQQQAQQQNQGIPFDPDSPKRSALRQLIDYEIWDEVARQQGITVTQGQIDRFLGSLGGSANVDAIVLASDVPVSHTADLVRIELIRLELLRRNGVQPNAQGQVDQAALQRANQQIQVAYATAAKQLKIDVNPRFGRFDLQNVTLSPVAYGLSKRESGTG
jgi:hypothetical protein